MKIFKKFLSLFLLILFSGLFFLGCLLKDDNMPEPAIVAHVSIFQGSPNAPELDILIDNEKANKNPITYKYFSGYNSFYTGNRNFKFAQHNTLSVLVDTTVSLNENKVYSMFIANEESDFKAIVSEDEWFEPSTNHALIRIVQLSPDAPPIDFYIGNAEESFFSDQDFGIVSSFKEIESGIKDIVVRTAGEDDVIAAHTNVSIQSKRIYTIILRGYTITQEENVNPIGIQMVTNHTYLF